MGDVSIISEWNLTLARLLKEFTFDAGLPTIILFIACIMLWFCIFKKVVKLLFTFASLFIIILCYKETPKILLSPLLTQSERNKQENISEIFNKSLVDNPLPNCVKEVAGIVVLGSGIYQKNIPSSVAQTRLMGLSHLIKNSGYESVWSKHKLPIVFSGGKTNINVGQSEAEAMKNFASYTYGYDINNFSLIAEKESKNTYQNALFTKEIFEKKKYGKKIILLTSSQQMFRAKRVFRKQGFEVCPVPVATLEGYGEGVFNFANAAKSVSILNEYFGVVGYALKGWLSL
ncbi:YdcF family protein [Fluviispira sanaruensis]|uniref:YdcF family protein n=1 Tax=Fluviispira sanaruensis TaxID=2493639 RepID=A0A4P2VKM7_FLUSA|nr:YdcF family protein [Fluviispira sanaruensis]BBH53168.1 YdcF family protein [Fluviispira sanaruensis]